MENVARFIRDLGAFKRHFKYIEAPELHWDTQQAGIYKPSC